MTSPRREERRARAHAEFAGYPAPPTAGWWPCPRDAAVFRRFDGVRWTDWTREPATQRSGDRPSPSGGGSAEVPAGPSRGSAIRRGRWEMRRLIHPVTDEELRGIPGATAYEIEPDRPERGWLEDPAAPDIGQRRFHTGTDWSDLVVFVGRTGPSYYRSTLVESRRRNELRREEVGHEPSLTLTPTGAAWAVLLTAVASCLLIAAPALPTGTPGDLAHSAGVVLASGS